MILITREALAATAAERWDLQYPRADLQEPSRRIRALGPAPDPDAVDRIIGNDYWTTPGPCSECGAQGVAVAQVGQEPDYESATAWLCEGCARKALSLFGH